MLNCHLGQFHPISIYVILDKHISVLLYKVFMSFMNTETGRENPHAKLQNVYTPF